MGRKIIPAPGCEGLQFIYTDDSGSLVHIKDSVAAYNDLPITGNTENDLRIAQDTDRMYTWGIVASSGLLTDWKDIGSVASVDWSAITNKPDLIETSEDGDWKKVTQIQYNPITEKLRILYDT